MEALKKILALVRPYWGQVVLAGLLSLGVSGLNGALAWLVKPAVDQVFVNREATSLLLLSLGVMTIYLSRGIFFFFHSYLMRSAGAKVVRDIRNSIYRHMLFLPMNFLHKDSTGAMISRVINDAGAVQEMLAFTVKDLFVESGSVIVLLCVALLRRWDLTVFSVFVLPASFYFVSRLGKRLKKVSNRVQEKIAILTEMLAESFSGGKIIKSFCRENDAAARFGDGNQDYYREVMRSVRIMEGVKLIMEFVGGIGIASVLWYGGNIVIKGGMTTGDFFSFLAAIFMLYTPAKRLAAAHNSLQQAKAPLNRIGAFLKEGREEDGAVKLNGFSNEIIFEHVSFRYSETDEDALEDISISVKKAEIIAVVGRSGAGKTTFVDMLSRFYKPAKGRIIIDGLDIASLTLGSLRALIGVVSQDVMLFNDTIKANIAYGRPDATDEQIQSAAKAAYAHDFILQLPAGYETVVGERGVRLSGGQRQRLSIARALLKNPAILILDEATSSLDTESEIMVQGALENLMADRTSIVIAHRLSTVRRADRIIVFDRGRIIESGTHEKLLLNGNIYKKLYDLQFDDTAAEHAVSERPS